MVFWSKPPVAYLKLQAFDGTEWKSIYLTETLDDNLNVTNATHNLAVLYGFNGTDYNRIGMCNTLTDAKTIDRALQVIAANYD